VGGCGFRVDGNTRACSRRTKLERSCFLVQPVGGNVANSGRGGKVAKERGRCPEKDLDGGPMHDLEGPGEGEIGGEF